jgi:hypothetical protein
MIGVSGLESSPSLNSRFEYLTPVWYNGIREGADMRIVICSVCEKEWQLRSGMAFESLWRHIKREHKDQSVAQAA